MGSKGYVASLIFNNSGSCLASYLAVIERFPICGVVTFWPVVDNIQFPPKTVSLPHVYIYTSQAALR